jgi:hypothetical protein
MLHRDAEDGSQPSARAIADLDGAQLSAIAVNFYDEVASAWHVGVR